MRQENSVKEKKMKKSTILGCLIMLVLGCVVIAGCGSSGPSVAGVYKVEASGVTGTLTLKADGTGTISLTTSGGIPITYKVKNGSVVLAGMDGKELGSSDTFKIVNGGLEGIGGILWKKQ